MTVRLFLVLLALLLAAPAVRADLWAYVDETGKPHFANEKLDERYQLYFKGRSSLDPVPAAPKPEAAAMTPLDAVREHAIWKRIDGHPNVARFQPLVTRNARDNGLDPYLVQAVIAVESGY
ncbi:MAG TPA: DUF4124 domain-containing protein, partial [Steroidobacteraceae bacterium]